jgi:hypothetical protein
MVVNRPQNEPSQTTQTENASKEVSSLSKDQSYFNASSSKPSFFTNIWSNLAALVGFSRGNQSSNVSQNSSSSSSSTDDTKEKTTKEKQHSDDTGKDKAIEGQDPHKHGTSLDDPSKKSEETQGTHETQQMTHHQRVQHTIHAMATQIMAGVRKGEPVVDITLNNTQVPKILQDTKIRVEITGKTLTVNIGPKDSSTNIKVEAINKLIQEKMGQDLANNKILNKQNFENIKFVVGGETQEFQMKGEKLSKPSELLGKKGSSKEEKEDTGSGVDPVQRKEGGGGAQN